MAGCVVGDSDDDDDGWVPSAESLTRAVWSDAVAAAYKKRVWGFVC